MNDNNQLFTQYLTPLRDLKEILKTKDIILENNLLKNDMNSEDNKIQIFQNIFKSEELSENNPFIEEEICFIKDNFSNYDTNNSKEKFIRENFIKNKKTHYNYLNLNWNDVPYKTKLNIIKRINSKENNIKEENLNVNRENDNLLLLLNDIILVSSSSKYESKLSNTIFIKLLFLSFE